MSDQPKRLGRYELVEVLGRGAMGVVYKAHDSFLDRTVAVKTYRQDIAMSSNVRRRFEREVKTASKLQHPNIVTVYDGGLEGETPFLAMEYVEGTTLESELDRRGRLSIPEALALLYQVIEGLACAHAESVIHRDLKPANILLSKTGQVKIADFGVAKLMTADTGATVNPVGTPSYMSPEQVHGQPVDVRADVFAIGILAYQLLSGRKPFDGETWTAVLFQILNHEPTPPSEIRPELPRSVDEVVARALHKDVQKRTPDVATFGRELREAFERAAAATVEPTVSGESKKPRRRPPPPPDDRDDRDDEPQIARRGPRRQDDSHLSFEAGDLDAFRGLGSERNPRSARSSSSPSWLVPFLLFLILLLLGGAGAYFLFVRDDGLPPPEVLPPPTAVLTAAPAPEPTAAAPTQAPRPTATIRPPTPTPRRATPTPQPAPTATPAPARPTERPRPTAAPPTVAPVAVPPTPLVEPRRSLATMDVLSEPPRAEVIVNGVRRGTTPLRVSDLEPGRYEFEVRKEGYVPYTRTTELEGKARYEMKVTLVPVVNSLRVLSAPSGAQVFVNGVSRGVTPLTLGSLASGTYEVETRLEGRRSPVQKVELKDGELEEIRFTFPTSE